MHAGGGAPEASFERPPKPEFGDYSTNAALLLAPLLGEQPRIVAERLGELLLASAGAGLDRVEVAGPGFLNLFLADDWFRDAADAINVAGVGFGSGVAEARSERTLVEFVSANPTGPVTVASGRHAAYGDSLARILEFAGHAVEREYYMNDAGAPDSAVRRVDRGSDQRREIPEGGYQGEYVADLAEPSCRGRGDHRRRRRAPRRRGVELMRESIEASLARFGSISTPGSRSARCTTPVRSTRRIEVVRARRRHLRERGRAVDADVPTSVTTRTA